MEAKSS